jgi:hypothetical protein
MARPSWAVGIAAVAGVLILVASTATADEIQLRHGGRISGVLVEKTEKTLTIDTGPGRVTLPLALVEKIVEGRSVLAVWQERAAALAASDAQGWAALARWAGERDLPTQERIAWQHVLAVDPGNAEANAAVGRVLLDGTWVSQEDAYRAQGLVPFEGRWVTRPEYESVLQQQAAENASQLQQREAQVRLREAEARAREAEAHAREAESAPSSEGGGIPLWGGYGGAYGGGYGGGYGYGGVVGSGGQGERDRDRGRDHRGRDARKDAGGGRGPQPAPTPRPGSLGPTPGAARPHGQPVPDRSSPRGSSPR